MAMTISTDGIEELTTEPTEDAVWSLSGQRISAPHSGLYIKNGKKYMVK